MVTLETNGTVANANNAMANWNKAWAFAVLNKIRQTIDRVSVDSAGQDDIFTEAYVDSDGRNNSVNIGNTTAVFETNKYEPLHIDEASGDTTSNNGMTNPENAFDGDDLTSATISDTFATVTSASLGKTFNAKTVYKVFVKASFSGTGQLGDGSWTANMKLQIYNGSVWNDVQTLISLSANNGGSDSESFEGYINISGSGSIQGIRVNPTYTAINGNADFTLFTLEYGSTPAISTIEHTIPTGTYPATISKLIGKVLYENWESGVTVEHKITNATEDSGWVNDGELVSFIAFTSEPTKYLIRLTPKNTNPTPGYPSIRGFGFYCE